MTLARLVLAWLAVSAWFLALAWVGARVAAAPLAPGTQGRSAAVTLGEAAAVTLFASLWFDSLGHGGWWLLFLLVGAIAAFPVRLQGVATGVLPRGPTLTLALLDVGRYLGAGALLAWRLR